MFAGGDTPAFAPLLGVVLTLGGCAVGPDFSTPEAAVPKTWSAADDPHVATRTAADQLWWKVFNDSTLDRLIEIASRQNLPLQIASIRILEARARLAVATGQQFPQHQELFASATAVGLSQNAPYARNLPRHFGDYQLGFDAAWELDLWGKYRRGVEAETAGMLASIADYYGALVSLIAEVARTYVTIRTSEVLIERVEENVRLQEEALAIAESRYQNGATSELDPSQATTLLNSTRASIPPLQTGLQQARNALSTLLGQPTGAVTALLAGPKEIPKAPAKVAVGMPAELLRRRPDIRSAELIAAAQCARIGVAKADLYPSFSLVGTVGLETSSGGATPHEPLSIDSVSYSVGPQIHWAFLNYGRLTNAVRIQDARFQELLVGYRNVVLKAAQEVEDALTGFLRAQDAVAFEQSAVKSARRSMEIAVVEYREGAADYQRVLDAERSLLEQQTNLTQTTSSIATYLIALYKALGGGWELRQGQPVLLEQTRHEMQERTDWGDMLPRPRAPEPQRGSAGPRPTGS